MTVRLVLHDYSGNFDISMPLSRRHGTRQGRCLLGANFDETTVQAFALNRQDCIESAKNVLATDAGMLTLLQISSC